ncbi:MAG TPA: lysophospholipid acyltransferase family protein [Terriglobia bacterium]|nr:lysophospholipid acyltransferase family protein [Terriglobia bacterium]
MQQEPAKAEQLSAAASFSRSQRLKACLIGWAGYFAISLIGWTIRWRSEGDEHLEAIYRSGSRAIFTFWHGRIFPATFYYRNRDIVVMTSMNLDGEAIAQCIRRLGYDTARGSSSRGGMKALAELVREIRAGRDAGFTIDGPRGPRYIAKQGPVLLAYKTGAAIFCFHVSMKHKIQLKSWDEFQIPLPFTRAIILKAPPIWVPRDSSKDQLRDLHEKMQRVLDELRIRGDAWFVRN